MDVSSAMVSTGLSLLPSSSPPAGGKSLEFRACLPLLGTQTDKGQCDRRDLWEGRLPLTWDDPIFSSTIGPISQKPSQQLLNNQFAEFTKLPKYFISFMHL